MLDMIIYLILLIFGMLLVYLFSDEHLDKAEDKMIKNIVKERLESSDKQ